MSADIQADVIVIGSGVAGALVATGLALAGVKVAVLECGPPVNRSLAVIQSRNAAAQTPDSAYSPNNFAPSPSSLNDGKNYYVQDGPDDFGSNYERVVGGTTWHWLGTALRLVPNDFSMQTSYGVGVNWPITYNDVEPWYGRAESALGVSGDSNASLGSPRTTPYPMPPIQSTYFSNQLAASLQPLGITVANTPQARNSVTYDNRPACCGNAWCIPVCPIGAKFDGAAQMAKAQAAGAQLVNPALVTRLETDASGRISAAVFRDPGVERRAFGKVFVLAAHAIESPKILLMSTSSAYRNGLANSSGQVGRNLSDHPTLLSYALAPQPIYPGRSPLSTSGIEQFRDGSFRSQRGAFRVEIGDDAWSWPVGWPPDFASTLVDQGVRGPALRQAVNQTVARQFRLAALIEQLPDPNNRIVPDYDLPDAAGIPRPKLTWSTDAYTAAGRAAAQQLFNQIYQAYGATNVKFVSGYQGAGHIIGTLRMGTAAGSSVVDANLRSFDHPNLYIQGSSTFPSTGTANPTLTIAALALRSVPAIQQALAQLPQPGPSVTATPATR